MNRNYSQYKKVAHAKHRNLVTRTYFDLYAWFWFHTQFWIHDKEQRRPYTFIMRDWIYPHPAEFITLTCLWYGGMIAWVTSSVLQRSIAGGVACLIISILTAFLWGHLRWAGWKKGEQEWPPILDI